MPVAHYLFDDTAQDAEGPHHGMLIGGATFATGKLGQALALDGVNDYVTVAHNTALNPSTAATIAGWFKADVLDPETDAGDSLVMKGNWNSNNSYSLVFYQGQLRCNIGRVWNAGLTYAASNFTTGQWYHVACRADASGHTLFVNGVPVAANATAAGSVTDTNPLVLGYNGAAGTVGFFDGLLDDMRLYTVALSNADIQALVSRDITPNPPTNLRLSIK
jgi:hypothetical protein